MKQNYELMSSVYLIRKDDLYNLDILDYDDSRLAIEVGYEEWAVYLLRGIPLHREESRREIDSTVANRYSLNEADVREIEYRTTQGRAREEEEGENS